MEMNAKIGTFFWKERMPNPEKSTVETIKKCTTKNLVSCNLGVDGHGGIAIVAIPVIFPDIVCKKSSTLHLC